MNHIFRPMPRLLNGESLKFSSVASQLKRSHFAPKVIYGQSSSMSYISAQAQKTNQIFTCLTNPSRNQRTLHTTTNLFKDNCDDQTKYEEILLTKLDKNVTHIEFNRAKVKNAFSLETGREFIAAFKSLEDDPTVRCVILSGNGPDFSSGVDLKSFLGAYAQLQEMDDVAQKAKLLRQLIEQFQAPFKQMYSFTKPIICVQHGFSFGLSMELAACSDIRYCSKDVKLAISEVLIGIAADVGSLQLLPKLMSNQSLLRELIYSGRNISAQEALELGFISRVFETKADAIGAALETAKMIACRSPVAIQGAKQNLRFSSDKSFQVGLDYNAVWNMSMMQSGDVVKAITAILSKSGPADYDDF